MHFNVDKLDKDIQPDVLEILKVAALLDTTEFKVFSLAWGHWYGEEARDPVIEPHFSRYMLRQIVPPWVHHFTRYILRSECSGEHLREHYGLKEPPPSPRLVFLGRLYTAILTAAVLFLILLTSNSNIVAALAGRCFFPPCY